MNIIANNCAGAAFYQLKNCEYNNPFMWSLTTASDFLKLIKNFDKINFNEFELVKLDTNTAKTNCINYDEKKRWIGVNIDNICTTWYIHYCFSACHDTPTKINNDIYYRKNYEYVYQKYVERAEKFAKTTETPCFLIVCSKKHEWTEDKINELLSIDTHYKICLITDYKLNVSNKSITYVYEPNVEIPITEAKKHLDDIEKFIHIQ